MGNDKIIRAAWIKYVTISTHYRISLNIGPVKMCTCVQSLYNYIILLYIFIKRPVRQVYSKCTKCTGPSPVVVIVTNTRRVHPCT